MINVYGFGSFFARRTSWQDKDILLVHENISPESCAEALKCKRTLAELDGKLDIVILSTDECRQTGILGDCAAVWIGQIADVGRMSDYFRILVSAESKKGVIAFAHNKAENWTS